MKLEELFKLVNTYEDFNFTLWNIYIAVVAAVLTYSIGSDKVKRLLPRIILACIFAMFCYGNARHIERNLLVINGAAKEIELMVSKVKFNSSEFPKSIPKWACSHPTTMITSHYIFDFTVIILILFGRELTKARFRSGDSKEDSNA